MDSNRNNPADPAVRAPEAFTVSIIVSTRNRGSKLRHLLASLIECEVPPATDWEIIVADNDSRDDTAEVMKAFVEQHPGRGLYVYQSTRAKATGLNLALRNARGNLVALTDDDARVERNWLVELIAAYRNDSRLAGLGGRVELFDPTAAPVAVRRSREPMIISERPFDPRSIPVIGCNLSFRRSVLDEAGAYDERFGPGSTIGSGDDVDMLYRIQRAGHKLVYAPQVVVYHDHGRRVGEDEGPTIYRYLRGRGGFYTKYIALRDRHITKCAYRELRQASLTMLRGMFHGCIDRPTLALLRALASGAVAYMRAPSKQQIQPAMIRILPAPAAAADSTAQPSTAFTK